MPTYDMLHGTSSSFLDSIKRDGLVARSKNKIWSDYSKATYDHPSCKSLIGTYFTNNLNIALAAASNAREKFSGDSLIISATIDTATALSDEDNIWCWVETWLDKTFEKSGFSADEADKFLGFVESQSSGSITHLIKWFSEKLHRELTDQIFCKIDYDLLREAFHASLMRRCSHLYNKSRPAFCINYQSQHKLFKLPSGIKNINEAEQLYIDTVEKLSIHYTESCVKNTNLHTLRVPIDVGFSGRNRINGMVVMRDYKIIDSFGNVEFIREVMSHHKNFALCGI